jgi:hypothetical protein
MYITPYITPAHNGLNLSRSVRPGTRLIRMLEILNERGPLRKRDIIADMGHVVDDRTVRGMHSPLFRCAREGGYVRLTGIDGHGKRFPRPRWMITPLGRSALRAALCLNFDCRMSAPSVFQRGSRWHVSQDHIGSTAPANRYGWPTKWLAQMCVKHYASKV